MCEYLSRSNCIRLTIRKIGVSQPGVLGPLGGGAHRAVRGVREMAGEICCFNLPVKIKKKFLT